VSVLVCHPENLELATVYATQRGHEPILLCEICPENFVYTVDDDCALDIMFVEMEEQRRVEIIGKPWEAAYRAWESAGPRARPAPPKLRDRLGESE
jgi:hypothetical protein